MFTLLLTSLIVLSTERVAVHVETMKVEHLSEALCKSERDQWRKKGPGYQATCVPENR